MRSETEIRDKIKHLQGQQILATRKMGKINLGMAAAVELQKEIDVLYWVLNENTAPTDTTIQK